jgi:hypothetical protein
LEGEAEVWIGIPGRCLPGLGLASGLMCKKGVFFSFLLKTQKSLICTRVASRFFCRRNAFSDSVPECSSCTTRMHMDADGRGSNTSRLKQRFLLSFRASPTA